MPIFWLRVALVFYGAGMLYALTALTRRSETAARILMPLAGLGLAFHFVSLTEQTIQLGHFAPATIHQSESLLAFLVMLFFAAIFVGYRLTSPGIFVFPVVFLLTFAAAIAQEPPRFENQLLRSSWIIVHIALIFTGYAALFFSFATSVLYLLQERQLKAKRAGTWLGWLPALETLDEIGYRSLLLGFPFMTFGLIAGAVVASAAYGPKFLLDPKIVLSVLMWAVYLVLLYTRWSSGWRGRKAAYLVAFAFVAALAAWGANYFSGVHSFVVKP
ncbi:MAG TPA: cytochrome c biogenesis protein CcsA [Terriglobales bacterium]|nr:cytochrome c biogenesis protein CcsA [Terriglobales bacterium]